MKVTPLHDRIVVRLHKDPVETKSGIFIGEHVDDGFTKEIVEGEVLAVGPGMKLSARRRDSMWDLRPGHVVKFSPVCSVTQVIDGQELTLIRRDAVIGLVGDLK